MNAIEIVKKYLKEEGYGGLVCPQIECGCCLEDLQPCGEDFAECKPAFKHALKPGDSRGDFLMSTSDDPDEAGIDPEDLQQDGQEAEQR